MSLDGESMRKPKIYIAGPMRRLPDEPQPIIARIWPIIEVPYCDAIPSDYPGPMGVPISYLDKHDPDRFIILDHIKPKCHGKDTFERIVIVNKHFCTGRFQVYKKPIHSRRERWKIP